MPSYQYEYVTSASRLAAIANEIIHTDAYGLDLETTGLMPHNSEIRLCQINTGKGIYVIDLFQTKTLEPVLSAIRDTKAVMIGQNCLTGRTRVTLADGTEKLLSEMVAEKHPGPVLTLNETTGEVEARPVTGWIRGETRAWAEWRSLEFEGRGRVNLTEDHEVLTSKGRKKAGDLVPGDCIWTARSRLTVAQAAVVLGTLLGDGSLVSDQKNCSMRSPYVTFSHCLAQEAYATWKADLLGDLGRHSHRDAERRHVGFALKGGTQQIHFRTRCDSRLLPFVSLLKKEGQKRITPELLSHLTAAAVAIWLCDDGSRNRSWENDGSGFTISACVTAFGDSYTLLVDWLRAQGWPVRVWTRPDGHVYLKIGKTHGQDLVESGLDKFWREVAPFFPTSMGYKVPAQYRNLLESGWASLPQTSEGWSEPILAVRMLAREKGHTKRYGGFLPKGKGPRQFCLQVEGNHNFLANGFFVSNCKFEQKFFLHKYGVELWPLFDTYRASAIIYNGKFTGKGQHDLYALYARELNAAPEIPDSGLTDWSKPILDKSQLDYAAEDVVHLFALRTSLKSKLKELGLNRTALAEFGAILPEAEMELNGIYLDADRWMENVRFNEKEEKRLHRELLQELPHPSKQLSLLGFDSDFNLDSSAQMLKSLQMLGMPVDSTNEMTIAMHATEFPIVSKILEYKEYAHARKNFGADYLDNIFAPTGRVHTNYYPFTGAGRYSSSKPNLQQLPRKKEYRRCFRAPEGKRLVIADLSQIELRITAEITSDEALMGVYIRREDAHAQTASIVSGVPLAEITKALRNRAKAVNFGFIYGMQAKKFVLYAKANYGVDVSLREAYKIRDAYFDGYPGVRRWHDEVLSDNHKRSGLTRTLNGRLRYLPSTAHSEWANTVVQGTGADGLKIALRLIYKRLQEQLPGRARMLHMVHDEVILEVDDDPEVCEIAERLLIQGLVDGVQPLLPRVPVEAEGGTASDWSEK